MIIINASNVQLTGNKWAEKSYIRHTGYPGGQKSLTATELKDKNPARVVEKAVKGMLPKNKLGSVLFRNLKVYADANHGQEAQNQELLKLIPQQSNGNYTQNWKKKNRCCACLLISRERKNHNQQA